MSSFFMYLGIMLLAAFLIAFLIRALKQPIVIGYILAGIIIGPFILQLGAPQDIISLFSEIGIAFLLFTVGIHLNPKVIKEIGFSSLIIGILQMLITFSISFIITWQLLNFTLIQAIYIAIALTFSSTIIIIKMLSDKRKLDTLYGKIAIGVLILQDLAAIIILMMIASLNGAQTLSITSFVFQTLVKGSVVLLIAAFLGYLVLPSLTARLARNQELLFLFSITWCFLLIAIAQWFGFSIEIGALVAGVTLALSPVSHEISSKVKPLRDFFLILFFIILGMNSNITQIQNAIVPALWLSAIVIFIKPLILMIIISAIGYTKRTIVLTAGSMAHISEFSLIIIALGVKSNHLPSELLSTLTLTGIITITISTYFIIYGEEIYNKTANWWNIFERKKHIKERENIEEKYDAILFGYNRIGFGILNTLKKIHKNDYLVVDYNPETIRALKKYHFKALYGDAYDSELLEKLPFENVNLIVSTIPDFEINALLIKHIKRRNPDAIVIVIAHQISDAFELYSMGANYVLTPHFLGGDYVNHMLMEYKTDAKKYEEEKKKHIEGLKARLKEGQEHPKPESGR